LPGTARKAIEHIALVAVFNADDEILLFKRPIGMPQGGLWSFPGGKVETGEAPLDAAQRELFEEAGIAGLDWKLLGECEYSYPNADLYFHLFSCHSLDVSGLSCPEPHTWVPAHQLDDYRMPQANIEVLNPMVAEHASV